MYSTRTSKLQWTSENCGSKKSDRWHSVTRDNWWDLNLAKQVLLNLTLPNFSGPISTAKVDLKTAPQRFSLFLIQSITVVMQMMGCTFDGFWSAGRCCAIEENVQKPAVDFWDRFAPVWLVDVSSKANDGYVNDVAWLWVLIPKRAKSWKFISFCYHFQRLI